MLDKETTHFKSEHADDVTIIRKWNTIEIARRKPDPNWFYEDSAGHTHYWSIDAKLPTLHRKTQMVQPYDVFDEPYEESYYVCKKCEEVVAPRYIHGQPIHQRELGTWYGVIINPSIYLDVDTKFQIGTFIPGLRGEAFVTSIQPNRYQFVLFGTGWGLKVKFQGVGGLDID